MGNGIGSLSSGSFIVWSSQPESLTNLKILATAPHKLHFYASKACLKMNHDVHNQELVVSKLYGPSRDQGCSRRRLKTAVIEVFAVTDFAW